MKKFAIAMLLAGIALVGISPTVAGATKPTPEGFHKVTICHNVSHNPHAISIDVASVAGSQETKHGLLTLDADLKFVSFVPHDSSGHDKDFYLHNGAEVKPDDDNSCKGNNEEPELVSAFACFNGEISTFGPGEAGSVNAELDAFLEANDGATEVDSADDECVVDETTTTTQPEVTTTTTAPVVTTTTAPVVTTTTEPIAPVVPVAGPVAAPVAAPTALPHTGAETNFLAMLGVGLAMIGSSLKLLTKRVVA